MTIWHRNKHVRIQSRRKRGLIRQVGRGIGGKNPVDAGDERGGPYLASGSGWMYAVRHDFTGYLPIRQGESVGDVNPHDRPPVRKTRNGLVDAFAAQTHRIVSSLSKWEDCMQKYPGIRLPSAQLVQNGFDSQDRIDRRLFMFLPVPRIVDANEQDNGPGLVAVQLSVSDSPQHILRVVAAKAKVERTVRLAGEIFISPESPFSLPAMRDRVSKEHDARTAVRNGRILLTETPPPPSVRVGGLRHGRHGSNLCAHACRRHQGK